MTTSRGIERPPAHGDAEDRAAPAGPSPAPRRSASVLEYVVKVLVATVIETAGIYLWLRFHTEGHLLEWSLLALILGESVETGLFRTGTTRDSQRRWGSLARDSPGVEHFRKVQRRVFATGVGEVLIWLLWLYTAEAVGWLAAGLLLLVLMHLKHHVEVATVRDLRFRERLFTLHGASASALEVAGGVACLELLKREHYVLAAVALGGAILLEHALQIDILAWEMKARDIRLPRNKRWKHPPRRRPVLFYLFTHFAWFWRRVQRIAPLERWFNRFAINGFIAVVEARPNPLSTMADYTSWPSLTDLTYSGRHLPPVPDGATCPVTSPAGPPSVVDAAALFERRDMIECPKSTLLFAFFAQWFTDGFLRSARNVRSGVSRDTRRNESPHEIDLCQLYGLTQAATRQLKAGPDGFDAVTKRICPGLLKNQLINDEEYPQFYCERGLRKDEFAALNTPVGFADIDRPTRDRLFAIGTDVTNVGALACNVLFLREHNRIARCLGARHPRWDDARVFETTRNILTVMLLKIVVEDYVNHITPNRLEFRVAPDSFTNAPWKRPNRMAIEFNLLYRWHSLVPSTFDLNGREYHLTKTLWDTRLLTNAGLGSFMAAASAQPAGRIGLRNTDPLLVGWAEVPSIQQARAARLCSYNDYRRLCGLIPAADFHEISSDRTTQEALFRAYGSPEAVEFYVGLFAEDLVHNSILPELMLTMVAFDAFSQALNNPLLAPRIYNGDETFSAAGRTIIDETRRLSDVVQRNTRSGAKHFVSFTRSDYRA